MNVVVHVRNALGNSEELTTHARKDAIIGEHTKFHLCSPSLCSRSALVSPPRVRDLP